MTDRDLARELIADLRRMLNATPAKALAEIRLRLVEFALKAKVKR